MSDIAVDIRELKMERGVFSTPNHGVGSNQYWMTLGPFNWLYVNRIEESSEQPEQITSLLDLLRSSAVKRPEQDISRESFFQSTFLFRVFINKNQFQLAERFWSQDLSSFMLVTRVNGTFPDQSSIEENIGVALGSPYTELSDEKRSAVDLNTGFVYERYRTLGLADITVVIRSNAVSQLMLAIEKLYRNKQLGDLYSLCCIDYNALSSPPVLAASERIANLSIRMSIKDSTLCDRLLEVLRPFGGQPYFVTGTEDIDVHFTNITEYDMCKMYGSLLGSPDDLLQKAVDDMVSRLGICYCEKPPIDGIPWKYHLLFQDRSPSIILSKHYRNLLNKVNNIPKSERNTTWLPTLKEVLRTLISVGRNSISQQLCYLLARPVQLAVERLSLPEIEWQWNDDVILEFMTGLMNILEYTTRLEGSLVHIPEIRPRLLDIPSDILEYDLTFVRNCSEYMKKRESGSPNPARQSFEFLITPCLCRNITIHDWFNRNNPSEPEVLLYVEIPLSLAYSSFEAPCDLIHEVSHHSGCYTRNRSFRFEAIIECVAYILADEFNMIDDTCATDEFAELLKSKCFDIEPEKIRLLDLQVRLRNGIEDIIFNSDRIELVVQHYIQKHGLTSDDAALLYHDSLKKVNEIRKDGAYRVLSRLNSIITLLSECYADLSMVSLLDISPSEYVKLFERHYHLLNSADYGINKPTLYADMITRIGLVLVTLNKTDHITIPYHPKNTEPNLLNDAFDFVDAMIRQETLLSKLPKCPGEESIPYLPLYVMGVLTTYLQECLNRIHQLDNEHSTDKRNIKNQFDCLARGSKLTTNEFVSVIETSRVNILKALSQSNPFHS